MLYPEEFKQKIVATFPENVELIWALENNDEAFGRMLFDLTIQGVVSVHSVIEACEDVKKMPELYSYCKRVALVNSLYEEYTNIKADQMKRTGNN